mmetsp:Transcript_17089/g.29632  ORF Transcript_17089/g.29632 Transcript_17089/m.29632 type:complete len:323 (+) Transcript_17089:97-1065(+)
MVGGVKAQKKANYFERVQNLLDEYTQILIVTADNVGAHHLSTVRKKLRPFGAVVLMGKNTLIRKAIRDHLAANEKIEALLPHVRGNIGFILCKGHIKEVLEIVETERVAAPAKAGSISPLDVTIPAGNTGLEPTQTSFLQALNIATKITRGQIEILKEVELLKIGVKVGNSEAALLDKLNIKPFTYGLTVNTVYDNGETFDVSILKITEDDIIKKFMAGVQRIASISLAVSYPTLAALPHLVITGYKNVLAIALATDYTPDEGPIKDLKDLLNDPEALAKAAAAAAAASGGAAAGGAPAAEEKKEEEEEEESDEEMGFDLFD